jgi:hypothetical protein
MTGKAIHGHTIHELGDDKYHIVLSMYLGTEPDEGEELPDDPLTLELLIYRASDLTDGRGRELPPDQRLFHNSESDAFFHQSYWVRPPDDSVIRSDLREQKVGGKLITQVLRSIHGLTTYWDFLRNRSP